MVIISLPFYFSFNYLGLQQIKVLKVGLSPSKKVSFVCSNGRPLKMMKNAFYFILKALSILKIFKFLPKLFGQIGKRASKKAMNNFKIYASHSGQQITTVHILPNISRSKRKQTMKFDQ